MGESIGQNLRAILDYIQAVEKASASIAYKIPSDDALLRAQDAPSLPGVSLASSGDSARWLSVSRLAKTAPPALPEGFDGVIALSDDPYAWPEIPHEQEARLDALGTEAAERAQALLAQYLANDWNAWRVAELPRRKSIALYQKLFQLHLGGLNGEGPVDLLWGMADASWAHQGKIFDYPMFTQACKVELDKETFELSVSPLERPPFFEKDAFEEMAVPGLAPFKDAWADFLKSTEQDDAARMSPFDHEALEPILSKALALLSASGRLDRDARRAPSATGALVCTFGWVVFTRKRANHFLLQDLENLGAALAAAEKAGEPLPDAAASFVSPGADRDEREPAPSFRGLSSAGVAAERELYFPLPYNDEQVRIIQELERSPGVVVQGPPGTGKTHTIANVICHYLALGKKVLVTSKDEPALRVVKEKIPDKLRQLCVALLGDEADGAKQFEESIKMILEDVAKIDPRAEQEAVERLDARIGSLHGQIASLDSDVAAKAAEHGALYPMDGQSLTLEDVAKRVAKGREAHGWMLHDALPEAQPGGAQAQALTRELGRWALARDLGAPFDPLPAAPLPDLSGLPSGAEWARMSASEHRRRAVMGARGLLPAPAMDAELGATACREALELAQVLLDETARSPEASTPGARHAAAAIALDPELGRKFDAAARDVERLEADRKSLMAEAVSVPPGAELQGAYRDAVASKAAGDNPFGFLALFGEAKKIKALIESTTVAEMAPERAGWGKVLAWVDFLRASRSAASTFEACARSVGYDAGPAQASALKRLAAGARSARALRQSVEMERSFERLSALTQGALGWSAAPRDAQGLSALKAQLALHQELFELEPNRQALLRLRELPFLNDDWARALRELAVRAAEGAGGDDALAWERETSRAAAISRAQDALRQASGVLETLDALGMPEWARALRQSQGAALERACAPSWGDAWAWRAWSNRLDQTAGREQFGPLFDRRQQLEAELAAAYRDSALKRTWIAVQRSCSPKVQQALQAYLASIQAMGKGTGVRAARHRQAAKEALRTAREAVRCWIMPHWRVSETMPAEIGAFDLVIVDEASQSDIWALPAILRGQKILIVGDHKQVSPAAVGVTEEQILSLHQLHLAKQPHGRQMTQDKSIYDLGRVVFASGSVMLKEHFRCAPSIIEFSNRTFYNHEIIPLRSPKKNEGVGATLVDLYVKNGFRDAKDANLPEALAIVDEIQALLRDPVFKGKTFGVVTLMGAQQENVIRTLIGERIPQEDILGRQIMVGNPVKFQGSERDVIFLSMVIARDPASRSKVRAMARSAVNEQRLNVAMSRARDRVYLVRSLHASDLSDPESLTGQLLAHFQRPFAQNQLEVASARDLCESGFEEDVFDALTSRGYRVRPQVACGKFRIDMVVESDEGERVAIECDGDRYHDGSVWLDDLRRQRVLERAGWVFWRCFASAFARDKEATLADLFEFLSRHGVSPTQGQGAQEASPLVESRVVEPDVERESTAL